MKKALLFSIMLIGLQHFSAGQWVTIPDPNFVAWLNANGYSSCMNGNQMDTTCQNIQNALSLKCTNNSISDLDGVQYFNNLISLNCSYNNLTSLPDLPPNLISLNCFLNNIVALPQLPLSLDSLICSYNNLDSVGALPANIRVLDIRNNYIDFIFNFPDSAKEIYSDFNQLINLPALPSGLEVFTIGNNQLSTLPALPTTLKRLFVSNNPLINLPVLSSLTQLDYFDCTNTGITTIPPLPGLYHLDCSSNNISTISTLPNSINQLIANSCQLIGLPPLPTSLKRLEISNNLLTILPALPGSLIKLHCDNNLLNTLPELPQNLTELQCRYNPNLILLPQLPDSMFILNISNNPNLNCIPKINIISGVLVFDSTNVQCLPNYGNVNNSVPSLNSIPLCDVFNINSCDFYYNIAGHVFADDNSNCIDEPNESSLPNLKINVTQAGNLVQQVFTSQTGLYTIDTQLGTYNYTVDTTGMPFVVNCPVSGSQTSTLTVTDSTDLGMDFGLQCKPGFDIGVVTVHTTTGQFFPADTASIYVTAGDISNLYNLTCASGISGAVTVYFTGPVQFAGALPGSLIPAVTQNTLTYTIPDFGAVNMLTEFGFNFITDTMAQAGQQVCFSVDVTPSVADLNPMNNMYTHCFTVVNSYDPNVKEANPISFTTPDNWITYTIHFQNTGTAPAQHIVITDTLDADLQEGTFAFLASSHQPFVNVTGNVIKFTFPNINLPDSTSDEPGSHGWVQYKVKSDPGLALGTTIENTANIYFDFNPPVITNTTVNTVVLPTSIQEADDFTFNLSPNPAAFETNIRTLVNGDYRILVIDMTGRTIYQDWFKGNTFPLQVENWPKGLFVVELQDSQGNISRRPLMTGN